MKNGFSLVELSIVLVILGLLVGGILAGQSLIRAAELRAVSTEYQRYVTALSAFRDKYFQIPGDMNNAVSFWGAAATCPSISATAAAGVCNGDADGMVENSATSSNEIFGLWEHLAYAGLVEGSYSGAPSSATYSDTFATLGTNVPRSKMNNAGWTLWYIAPITAAASTTYFEGSYGNMLNFGGTGGSLTTAPLLKPEEAWNIDTKNDDGKPATGRIVTYESQGAAASTTSCSDLDPGVGSMAASNYALANTGLYCTLFLKSGY